MSFRFYIITLFTTISLSITKAQNVFTIGYPKIFSYNIDQYNADIQNWSINQDDRGFIYFGNSKGLLIYDGTNWTVIPLPKVPIARDIAFTKDGIYVVGFFNFGKLVTDSTGRLVYKSLNSIFPKNLLNNLYDIWGITQISDDTISFTNNTTVFLYNLNTHKLSYANLPNRYYYLARLYNERIVAYDTTTGKSYLLDFKTLKFNEFPKLEKFAIKNYTYYLVLRVFNDKYLIYRRDSLLLTNKKFKRLKGIKNPFKHADLSSSVSDSNYIYLNPENQGLYILDSNLNVIYHLDKNAGLASNNFWDIFIDRSKNLWIATDNGINYIILNSAFSYMDQRFDLPKAVNNGFFDNKLFVAVDYSITYCPINDLLSPFSNNKTFKKVKNSDGQNWSMKTINSALFVAHNPGLLKITKNSESAQRIDDIKNNVWDIYTIKNKVILTTTNGLFTADIENGNLTNIKHIPQISGSVPSLIIIKPDSIWLLNVTNKAKIITGHFDSTFSNFIISKVFDSSASGINDYYSVQLFFQPQDSQILLNADNLIKIYNPDSDKFVNYSPILKNFDYTNPKVGIYLILIDSLNNLWVNVVDYQLSHGKQYKIFLFKHLAKDKYLFNKYLSNAIIGQDYYTLNGITLFNRFVFLNSTRGLVIYDNARKVDLKALKFNVYLSRIELTSNDSVIWYGNTIINNQITSIPPKLRLPYKWNGLKFYVTAPFYENPELTEYSFKLEGFDKNWSSWTTDNKKEYSYLKEGNYTLKVRARNIYGIETENSLITFRILPPWYRTIAAYIAYIIIFLGLIFISARAYAYNLRKKNEKLEQLIRERTREIEMKNAELEQQKEEIQTQAEELAIINRELEKLSLIVQKTDNAVILTDAEGNFAWVNPAFTKIFGYTLDELIDEVSPNIISNRTDPQVKKLIEKCMREKVTVEYEAQFKTKDGRYIWVHTTLTPILDENNNIQGLIAIDSDITKLKEAQERIKIQNENIKGSIRYAQVIQKSILPVDEDIKKFFDYFILYIPRDIVSGDFYWHSKVFQKQPTDIHCGNDQLKHQEYIFFAVVDCTGHGVPGAFMSLIGNRLLENIINQSLIHDPVQVLQEMDKRLAEIFKHTDETHRDGMVVSLCKFTKFCTNNDYYFDVTFAGAKLDLLVYKYNQKQLLEYKGVRRTIGQTSFAKIDFQSEQFTLHKNDVVFMYTDGYKDQNNFERKRIGINRFKRLLMTYAEKPMEQIKHELQKLLNEWMKNTEQRDDITVIGLKIK